MARYYFHLRDGHDQIIDPEGREVSEIAQIAGLALQDARSIIGHDAMRGEIRLGQTIDVLDEGGSLVHRLSFRDAITISE